MTVSFSADAVIEALYHGLLGREPDPEGRASYIRLLEDTPAALSAVVDALFNCEERRGTSFSPEEVMNALYVAAVGRAPDAEGRATYLGWIQADPSAKAIERIAAALFNSREHQNRLLPRYVAGQVLVDHSPNGEFLALLRHIVTGTDRQGLLVEVGLPKPSASFSIDFLKLSGWRGILIEPSPELRFSIESRFSGLNFQLVQARVLDTDEETPAREDPALRSIGLTTLERRSALVRLAAVLSKAGVASDFEILAVSGAPNTADVVNDMVEASDYRPAFLIVGLEPPGNWTTFSELGLHETVEQSYKVVSSMRRSMILALR